MLLPTLAVLLPLASFQPLVFLLQASASASQASVFPPQASVFPPQFSVLPPQVSASALEEQEVLEESVVECQALVELLVELLGKVLVQLGTGVRLAWGSPSSLPPLEAALALALHLEYCSEWQQSELQVLRSLLSLSPAQNCFVSRLLPQLAWLSALPRPSLQPQSAG